MRSQQAWRDVKHVAERARRCTHLRRNAFDMPHIDRPHPEAIQCLWPRAPHPYECTYRQRICEVSGEIAFPQVATAYHGAARHTKLRAFTWHTGCVSQASHDIDANGLERTNKDIKKHGGFSDASSRD